MQTICHITSAHTRYDIRIFVKECVTLAKTGYIVNLIVADGLGNEVKDNVNIIDIGKPTGRLNRMLYTPNRIYQKILEINPIIVHFHDPELMLIGGKLTKHGIKVIYDVHEDLPKQVLAKHWLPKYIRPLISFCIKHVEQFYSKKFAGVVTSTPIIARRFAKYTTHVILVCNYPLLRELTLNNTPWDARKDRLCYIGSISKTRGIEHVILSLAKSEIELDLAGVFSGDVSIATLSKLSGYKFVNFKGVLSRAEITQLLAEVKVGLVTLLPTPSYIESLPIKMFEYMASGIPIVASNFKLWHDIIKKHDCGILVDPNNIDEIAVACNYLIQNPDIARKMGENGRNVVLQYYNWGQESIKLIMCYQKILHP